MTTRNFSPAGIGYHPDYIGAIVFNRTGSTVRIGEVVMFDMKISDATPIFGGNATQAAYADVVSPGLDGFSLTNVVDPATAGLGVLGTTAVDPGFYFGIVDDLMADAGVTEKLIHVCLKGFTKVRMTSTVGAEDTVPGEYGKVFIGANGVRTATATTTNGCKSLGRLLEENTVADSLTFCLFNGIDGMGTQSAA